MRIDHLLPEYLHSNPVEREQILGLVGLPSDFDILGKQNFAPSCADCNDKKGSTILAAGHLAILIAKLRDKIPEVDQRENDRKAAKELDGILRSVARAVDSGNFSVQDFKDRLDALQPPKTMKLELAIKLGTDGAELLDGRTVILTERVLAVMRHRRITLAEVTAEVRRALEDPSTKIDRRSRSAYLIRAQSGLRVAFETWRNNVYITTAFLS